VKDLVDLMKSQPGKLNYASAGVGSTTHLAMEMLKSVSSTYALHIPYNGNGPAGTAVVAGQVEILFGSLPALLPHAKSGRVRALAVGTPKRSAAMPEVPTVAESGYGHAAADHRAPAQGDRRHGSRARYARSARQGRRRSHHHRASGARRDDQGRRR
jgi:tripartite-type tricarboxylate transporter receptor subunit TctC